MLEGAFAKVIAVGVLLIALLAGVWKIYHTIDKSAYERGRNEVLAETAQKVTEAVNSARVEEQQNSKRVQDAQANQVKAVSAKAADFNAVTSERDRLRDEVRAFSEIGVTATTNSFRAFTLRELFTACVERYGDVASKADGHALDAKTLLTAWPK